MKRATLTVGGTVEGHKKLLNLLKANDNQQWSAGWLALLLGEGIRTPGSETDNGRSESRHPGSIIVVVIPENSRSGDGTLGSPRIPI